MNVWDRSEWQISKSDSGLICQQHGMIMLILVKLGQPMQLQLDSGEKKVLQKIKREEHTDV